MIKAGIISLNINTEDLNHGAMLHSWAFQRYLRDRLGIESEVIDYVTPRAYGMDLEHPVWCHIKNKKIKPALVAALGVNAYSRRYKKFRRFIKEQYILTQQSYSQKELSEAKLDYDVIFCESDVIWDPIFFQGRFDPAFFLALSSMNNMRKIAYAPSMGNLIITPEEEVQFKKLVNHLDSISCRETYETEYVRRLSGKNVVTVVDPVLLLDRKDFEIITAGRIIDEPYVLLYTPVGYDLSLIKLTKRYAKEHDLKVIEVSRYSWNSIFYTTLADAGIEEFLSLICYAECIFTNSFHGLCISVLFHKEFYAFPRKTGRKIEDICQRLGLPERFISGGFRELPLINYDEVDRKLIDLRSDSEQFLLSALREMLPENVH